MLQPIKFVPYLKSTIWGGDRIAALKGVEAGRSDIGESWEISDVPGHESVVAEGEFKGQNITELISKFKGELVGNHVYERFGDSFPLLVKIIDAHDNLSLQVHPDDELAKKRHNSLGKTEMWYILESAPDALIHTGLKQSITADEYVGRVADGTLMDVVQSFKSAPGDVYFLPAGRLHAIGAGNLLVEIQETSDITYRVDDYGRVGADGKCRELHTELAKDAIDFTYREGCKSVAPAAVDGVAELVDCKYFKVCRVDVDGVMTIDNDADSFMSVTAVSGKGTIVVDGVKTPVIKGETVLIPASAMRFELDGTMSLITAVVPA